MAELSPDLENPYKCKLTLVSPRGKRHVFEQMIMSLTGWVDPSHQIVSVEERVGTDRKKKTQKVKLKQSCLVTPSLSLMLFMRETGHPCARDIEKVLKKGPWTFHHKVELQCKNAPNTSLAKQEFYKLADDLPLFAVCPVLLDDEYLRINIYVRNFSAMVDFYRLVTETEIETNKPEFCIFQIYRQPGLDIQLSLKRSQYIYPVPVESAYVSFNVKSIENIRLNCDVICVNGNVYQTRDPDGNLVVLYEIPDSEQSEKCSEHLGHACNCKPNQETTTPGQTCYQGSSASFDDMKSLKSHDSGLFSDVETSEEYRRNSSSNMSAKVNGDGTLGSIFSEGYASSNDSVDTFVSPGNAIKGRGKQPVNNKNSVKRMAELSSDGLQDNLKIDNFVVDKGPPSVFSNHKDVKTLSKIKQSNKITPVYL